MALDWEALYPALAARGLLRVVPVPPVELSVPVLDLWEAQVDSAGHCMEAMDLDGTFQEARSGVQTGLGRAAVTVTILVGSRIHTDMAVDILAAMEAVMEEVLAVVLAVASTVGSAAVLAADMEAALAAASAVALAAAASTRMVALVDSRSVQEDPELLRYRQPKRVRHQQGHLSPQRVHNFRCSCLEHRVPKDAGDMHPLRSHDAVRNVVSAFLVRREFP